MLLYFSKHKSLYLEEVNHFGNTIKGVERIGVSILENDKPSAEYDENKDICFFDKESDFITLKKGMFAIFFPTDLHMPGINFDVNNQIKKVVIKVRVD